MFNTAQKASTNKYSITDFSATVPNHSTTDTPLCLGTGRNVNLSHLFFPTQHRHIAMPSEEGPHATNRAECRYHFVSNQSVGTPPLVLPD